VIEPKSVSEAGFSELTILYFWFDESWPLHRFVC
jgi:hypothetical protein